MKDANRKKVIVYNPYTNSPIGEVEYSCQKTINNSIEQALSFRDTPTRNERYQYLHNAADALSDDKANFVDSIVAESGLCMNDASHEVDRACNSLRFAASYVRTYTDICYDCDILPGYSKRRIYSTRNPSRLILAITPFNHPLNQVVHKAAPAMATGSPLLLKPSEKTPLTAYRFLSLLYGINYPKQLISIVLPETNSDIDNLVADSRIDAISFTGSTSIGKRIANSAGYKRLCLELGGNSPLIVFPDANLVLAAELAAKGAYSNSGQRCTAVKRILVHADIYDEFSQLLVKQTKEWFCGDPTNPSTRVGTVISRHAAIQLQHFIDDAVNTGGEIQYGGNIVGALVYPTVITEVSAAAKISAFEAFGPLAPLFRFSTFDEAIALANKSPYALSAGVVTESIETAIKAINHLTMSTVNINEIPGYRLESTPFGGTKDSGIGVKEGVVDACQFMSTVKTYSLPWA